MTPVFGASVRRVEDPRLLTGQGRYVDDLHLQGLLHAVFVRTQVAHASIARLDLGAAASSPGVVAAWSAADLTDIEPLDIETPADDMSVPQRRVLATDRVRHFGEAVALLVAESPAQARDAADLVELDLDPLPVVVDVEAAMGEDAPLLYPEFGSNVAFRSHSKHGPIKRSFDRAAVVVRERLRNQRLIPLSIEPRGAIASWDGERLTLRLSSQAPHNVRGQIAACLGLDEDQVRVLVHDVGGGFGSKGGCLGEEVGVAAAARRLGRPVKWIEERWENCAATYHGRGQLQEVELAASREGAVLGIRSRIIAEMGAHLEPFTAFVPTGTPSLQTGCYRIPASQNSLVAVYTNTSPTGPYRGAGRPEAAYLIERMMDLLAAELDLDPAEVRRKNFVMADEFPYRSAGGVTYDSGDYTAALDRLLELAGYGSLRAAQVEARAGGRLVGIGLSTFIESAAGFGIDRATARLEKDGHLTVITGSTPHGQGHETTWAQIAADQFGVPIEKVHVLYGDTDAPAFAVGTFGSRSAAVSGAAVHESMTALRKRVLDLGAQAFEAAPADMTLEEGRLAVRGVPGRTMTLEQVAAWAAENDRTADLSVESEYDPPDSVFPFGAHLAHVEVDRETGGVSLLRYVAVDDCGNVINPLIVDGQIHGALAQGIAQALFEEAVFDENGQLLTGNLITYLIPSAADLPMFETDRTVTPTPNNPMGVKGVGEGGTIGSTPAVVNAVMDALRPLGIRHLDMPLTPAKIWNAIQKAKLVR